MPTEPTHDERVTAHAALSRLVGDVPAFVGHCFGQRVHHVAAADANGFADLLSLDDVDDIVASTGMRAPAFRLVRDGATLPRAAVTRRARIGSRPVDDLVDVAAVHREFAAGATIVLQGLHRSWGPVTALCRSLETSLTHPVQANAYLTPPISQGLHVHADPHDVFAVQTYGVKRWVVHPEGAAHPLDVELHPGDVLYLPAGTRHAAQTVQRPSLHLTIGVRTLRLRDVARRVVEVALSDPALDTPLPPGWAEDPELLATQLVHRLADVGRELAAVEPPQAATAIQDAADDFWGNRPPSLTGGLRDTLEVHHLDDATLLRRRANVTCRLRADGDQLDVLLGDRRLSMPGPLEPVLRRMAQAESFAPKELDDLIDEPSRLVLCRRLVREGLLTMDRSRGEPRG